MENVSEIFACGFFLGFLTGMGLAATYLVFRGE